MSSYLDCSSLVSDSGLDSDYTPYDAHYSYYPLPPSFAAAYIDQTAVSIVQYLEYYDNMWKDLMEQQDEYPLQE
ncbi:hypothetical protein D6C78_10552 [Aureobasidium pullulans]|uniref:Uncharacterized protein n=1 Tax=Aureobasidium pullulans TaxID=5580 RepID=A0A4T0B435_AURPU|nr:hypothetical protein D6C78_10552 [Aureobasidium pullulans]